MGMYEVGQLPETHLVGTGRRVIWHDDLAKFKQLGQEEICRPSNVLRRINQLMAKHPESRRWFITCDGRVGVTRKGFALLATRWGPEKRLAIDSLYSKARADARRETVGGKNMQDDQHKAHEPEPEEMAEGETIPPDEAANTALIIPEKYRRIHTICKATPGQIGGRDTMVVDARDLHEGLGVQVEFRKWLDRRIVDNSEFEPGVDFEEFRPRTAETSAGGRPPRNARLTIETAKRISMAEGGDVGKLVRGYYLWTEGVVEEVVAQQQVPTVDNGVIAMIQRMMESQERMMDRVLAKLDAPVAGTPPPPPRQPFPGGTESFKDFCAHHSDINVAWFQRFLSAEGIRGDGIKKDPRTGRWVCGDRCEQDDPRLLVDIKGVAVIAGVDKPYAHLTRAGVKHFTKLLHEMRKSGPLDQLSGQMKFDLGKKKMADDDDEETG
jgi:phage anti-repressor protein